MSMHDKISSKVDRLICENEDSSDIFTAAKVYFNPLVRVRANVVGQETVVQVYVGDFVQVKSTTRNSKVWRAQRCDILSANRLAAIKQYQQRH